MRPVLFRTAALIVPAYPAVILVAGILVVVTLALRSRRRRLDPSTLVRTMLAATVGGWVGARVLPPIMADGVAGWDWALLLPNRQVGLSLTWFLVIAFPLGLACLWPQRKRMMAYLDAICPSLLLGLAVVKVGCVLAGCCAGRTCPASWGIRYPFGSDAYVEQWHAGLVNPPASLLRIDAQGQEKLLGHAQMLRAVRDAPPPALLEHARQHGLSVSSLVDTALDHRSLPVWPVPIWYVLASGALWAAAEILFRSSRRAGPTTGFVLLAYGAMRLAFDGFVQDMDRTALGLTTSQLIAVPVALAGMAILLRPLYPHMAAMLRWGAMKDGWRESEEKRDGISTR